MKISIREALFGGEEVDDWEPPKSTWVALTEWDEEGWTDEALSMFPKAFPRKGARGNFLEIADEDDIYQLTTDDGKIQRNVEFTTRFNPWAGYHIFYNPDSKRMLITAIHLTEEEIEARLEEVDSL